MRKGGGLLECVEDIGSVDECKATVEQLERCMDAQRVSVLAEQRIFLRKRRRTW
jgi:hypothetical protein